MPECEGKLAALQGERSHGVQHALRLLAHIRDFAHKRLTTTVEEDRSVREHFEDVRLREEKAVSEKQQLQQRLKLERMQRQRQAAVAQRSQGAVEAQLTTMRAGHAAAVRGMRETAAATDTAVLTAFSGCAHRSLAMHTTYAGNACAAVFASGRENMQLCCLPVPGWSSTDATAQAARGAAAGGRGSARAACRAAGGKRGGRGGGATAAPPRRARRAGGHRRV